MRAQAKSVGRLRTLMVCGALIGVLSSCSTTKDPYANTSAAGVSADSVQSDPNTADTTTDNNLTIDDSVVGIVQNDPTDPLSGGSAATAGDSSVAGVGSDPVTPSSDVGAPASAVTDTTLPPVRDVGPRRVVQEIYNNGMQSGWIDIGWDPNRDVKGQTAKIDLGNGGGWLIMGTPPKNATAVEFKFRTSRNLGPVVRLILGDKDYENIGQELILFAANQDAQGWSQVRVPITQLAPTKAPFTQIRIAPARRLTPPAVIEIANLQLTAGGDLTPYGGSPTALEPAPTTVAPPSTKQAPAPLPGNLVPATIVNSENGIAIDCKAPSKQISPLIYGVGENGSGQTKDPYALNPGANRWGGNPTSRFNFVEGNTWNTAFDWYFRNVNITSDGQNAMAKFLDANDAHGVPSAVTVPALGWIAKDAKSFSFPVSKFGAQQSVDPDVKDAGNGKAADGTSIPSGSPKQTSVASTPKMVSDWVTKQLKGRTTMYFIDNEPELWDSTHRDVHPQPLSYDEELKTTIDYATVIRKADPNAVIAAPSSWGWPALFFSAVDVAAGFDKAPDRAAHGGTPFLQWYLSSIKAYEQANKTKLLNILDVHFYPQAKGVRAGGDQDRIDAEGAALRIRSVRGLWDPTYTDESWIAEPIDLIPRLQKLVDDYDPGLGISIGEWNFGGENHMSGGLAVAQALGKFGELGVTSAFYWTEPPPQSAAFWAFRAFTNFDGKGGRFGEVSMPATSFGDTKDLLFFSSRNQDRNEITTVYLNNSPSKTYKIRTDFANCGRLSATQAFTFLGSKDGFVAGNQMGASQDTYSTELKPYSITVIRASTR